MFYCIPCTIDHQLDIKRYIKAKTIQIKNNSSKPKQQQYKSRKNNHQYKSGKAHGNLSKSITNQEKQKKT